MLAPQTDLRRPSRLFLPATAAFAMMLAAASPAIYAQTLTSAVQPEATSATRTAAGVRVDTNTSANVPTATVAATDSTRQSKSEPVPEMPWHPLTDF